MLITEKKLRQMINQIISETRFKMPVGFSISGPSKVSNGKYPPSRFDEYCNAINEMVMKSGQNVIAISVIDPNTLDEEYGGISDDIHDMLNGNQSNNIYHNFGQDMSTEDNIQDLFRSEGPNALEDFFNWAQKDFVDFEEGDIFESEDSISSFYQGNGEKEYQVTVMFF